MSVCGYKLSSLFNPGLLQFSMVIEGWKYCWHGHLIVTYRKAKSFLFGVVVMQGLLKLLRWVPPFDPICSDIMLI